MKKRFAQLSQFLNKQTERNTPMAYFYTGFATIVILLLLYMLLRLITPLFIIRFILCGILILFATSSLGAIVIGLLGALFND